MLFLEWPSILLDMVTTDSHSQATIWTGCLKQLNGTPNTEISACVFKHRLLDKLVGLGSHFALFDQAVLAQQNTAIKLTTCDIDYFETRTSIEKFECLLRVALLLWKESSVETRNKSKD
jgi:hypothetical protein